MYIRNEQVDNINPVSMVVVESGAGALGSVHKKCGCQMTDVIVTTMTDTQNSAS
jgi:hypothetical protein